MNKDTLQKRLEFVQNNIDQARQQAEHMMAVHNMWLGRKEELLHLINDADKEQELSINQDNVKVVDPA